MRRSGFAKEPAQELNAARTAIASAKAAKADKYAAQEFAALQDSLKSAEAEIAKQKAASMFNRNYDKAKKTLEGVMALAAPLNVKAVEAKTRIMSDASNAISVLTSSVNDAKELVKKAPKGKGEKALFEAKAKDIAGIEASITGLRGLMTAGDYAGALEKANADVTKIGSIKTELSAEVEKSSKPKSKKKIK
jgi:hypothetical protein